MAQASGVMALKGREVESEADEGLVARGALDGREGAGPVMPRRCGPALLTRCCTHGPSDAEV